MNLTDDILNQLVVEDALNEKFCQLSLSALSALDNDSCIKIRALVQNKVMLLLLDSGSTHSFVSSSFVARAGLSTVPIPPKQVKLPNGDILTCDRMVPKLTWWCQGHTLAADMRVLDMDVYDGILGYDWLQLHSPIYELSLAKQDH